MKNALFWDIEAQFIPHPDTHYISATDFSRLMVCKIGRIFGGDYEECCLL
jgi:hypothetical protein